jgi:hypothetical protein
VKTKLALVQPSESRVRLLSCLCYTLYKLSSRRVNTSFLKKRLKNFTKQLTFLIRYGMTFTIGRGNDIVCHAIDYVAQKLVGKSINSLFSDMGSTWTFLQSDPQLRWIGPEKGVINIATGAVVNAVWDMKARQAKKPLWKLICDMSPEEFVKSTSFRLVGLTPCASHIDLSFRLN